MSRGFTSALVIIGVIILVLVAGGVYYAGRQYFKEQEKHIDRWPTPFVAPTSTGEIASPDLIGANWKTYTNTKFSYSISYPNNWEVTEARIVPTPHSPMWTGEILDVVNNEIQEVSFSETDSSVYQGSFQIRIYSNPKKLTLDQWTSNFKIPLVANPDTNLARVTGETTLDDKDAAIISINTLTVPPQKAVVTFYKGYIYYLTFDDWGSIYERDIRDEHSADKRQQTNDQILSTFKFTQ